MLTLYDLTVEYRREPLGVESPAPRFGWKAGTDIRNFEQRSCRIRVATAPEKLAEPDLWDSGTLDCGRSENIGYAGAPLPAACICWVQVDVCGTDGACATARTHFETALRHENFTASWIGQARPRAGWAPCLRREFDVKKPLERARLYICGLGYGEAWLNGQKVTEDVLEPMNTNFEKLLLYAAYDVTDRLYAGSNAIGVLLGCGFYSQDRVWCSGALQYGTPRLLAELHLWYKDGTHEAVLSDESWKCDYSPITLNNVYAGETYDARLFQYGWCSPGFSAAGWTGVITVPAPGGHLVCREMPPIRRCRRVAPVSIRLLHPACKDRVWIADMGENFAGWVKIHIPYSPAGTEYVLRFAERLTDGSLDVSTCGASATCVIQQDRYIACGAGGGETYEPRFTYHGFRYVEISGVNQEGPELPAGFIEGWAVNTDLAPAGSFHASFEPINTLQTLGLRTILSNYHGYPEDCPVREKCGWLGDAQLVCEAALNNFDMALSYEKYLEDIRTTKEVYGTWQMIAPGKRTCGDASPLWGCAQVVIPWMLYLYCNDRRVLESCYPLMREWVQHELERSTDYIISAGLGDWCPPGGHEGNAERIPVRFSSSAEFYHVACLTAKNADVLGFAEDAAELRSLAEEIRSSINRHFLEESVPTYGTMGADGVALAYGICPEELRAAVAKDCDTILNGRCGGGIRTGIYGNKYMVPAMTEAGYAESMLTALFSPDKTGFGTMIADGAASVWECFEAGSSSLNHPMQFAFASWFYTHILGLRPLEEAPGYRRFLVRPYPVSKLLKATGSRETPYGTICVSWAMDYGLFSLQLKVPANTRAVCELPLNDGRCFPWVDDGRVPPCTGEVHITCGGEEIPVSTAWHDDRLCFELGSGDYVVSMS